MVPRCLGDVSDEPLRALGLEWGRYLTLIAWHELENSILDPRKRHRRSASAAWLHANCQDPAGCKSAS